MDKLGKFEVSENENGGLVVNSNCMNSKIINPPEIDLLIINGAWYLDSLPNSVVAELEDGTLVMFFLTPFRIIKKSELRDYKGYHPRKCKGQPLPDYLYKFYGLKKK